MVFDIVHISVSANTPRTSLMLQSTFSLSTLSAMLASYDGDS